MILGIGNDIVEVARIKGILTRHPQKFLDRVFTPLEQEYCLKKHDPTLHLAGRFAVKEAIVKSLGTGFSQGLSWLDIEIRNDDKGKPIASLSPFALELFGDIVLHISLSHCHHYATAVAVCVKGFSL